MRIHCKAQSTARQLKKRARWVDEPLPVVFEFSNDVQLANDIRAGRSRQFRFYLEARGRRYLCEISKQDEEAFCSAAERFFKTA